MAQGHVRALRNSASIPPQPDTIPPQGIPIPIVPAQSPAISIKMRSVDPATVHGKRLVQAMDVLITTLGVVVVATCAAPLSILEIELNREDLLILAACVLYAF